MWGQRQWVSIFSSLKILGVTKIWLTFLWTLCWFPVFAVISFGQNSVIAVFGLSATYLLWKRNHTFLAGLVASLVLFKPQLIIGVSILWLIRWRRDWRALLGLATGAAVLISLTFLLLPEASRHYFQLATDFLPGMISFVFRMAKTVRSRAPSVSCRRPPAGSAGWLPRFSKNADLL
mgnify:CR=1 FL=1